jgi:hypothetical protein
MSYSSKWSETVLCVESASEHYTVVLEGSRALSEQAICDECVSDLREEEWIKFQEGGGISDPSQRDWSGAGTVSE